MDEEKQIKLNIKATRERKGYTRKQMAERLNLSVQGYSNLETGQTSLFTKSFRAFAEETEVPICELVSGLSYSEIEGLAEEKERYAQRLALMEKGFRQEIEELRKENRRLRESIGKLEDSIKDKDYIIETGKKLISRYEKEIERLSGGKK
ncbi:MAG: helix-turn-helix domain-containing protein [Candidatus Cryptobacteroides sp.]